MPPRMQRLRLPWGEVEYRRIGPATAGTTLVFLHEGLGCAAHWRDFPDALAAATGCAGLVYSRYGYGGSDPCPLPRPMRYMHDEALAVLPALLAALEVGPHVLVGHSDGGSIALIHAGGTPAPGLRGLILEAAHVFTEAVGLASFASSRAAYEQGDLKRRLARYHRHPDVAFYGWHDTWVQPGFQSWNLEAYLPGIRVPALVIQGRDDAFGTLAQVDAIVRQSGAPARPLLLDDCGHSPHRDQRAKVLAAMADFLAGLWESPA